MRTKSSDLRLRGGRLAAALLAPLVAFSAGADVTVSESTTFDLSLFKAHGAKTEHISGEKARTDSEMHCEGIMSMLCGHQRSGEITRLDKDLIWDLEPDKKSYLEKPFPTAAQIAEAQQRAAAAMEKLKSCPQPAARAAPPDTSKCDMSPPKFDLNKTNETVVLAGHQAQRTAVTMTQTCKNKDNGDSCDLIVAFDTWLTQDDVAGSGDIRAFRTAYNKKMGLDQLSSTVRGQMQAYLAPYADALRQVSAKAGDLKGYPLKTTMRVEIGGEHCSQAAQARQQKDAAGGSVVANAGDAATSAAAATAASGAAQAAGQAAGNSVGGAVASSAVGAFGSKLIGGLFAKKSSAPPTPASGSAPAAAAAAPVRLIEITIETTSISADSIAGSEFEIPAGWKKLTPKPETERELPQCPKEAT